LKKRINETTPHVVRMLLKKWTAPLYAIDDTTAIVVDGPTVSVVSEGKWKKYN